MFHQWTHNRPKNRAQKVTSYVVQFLAFLLVSSTASIVKAVVCIRLGRKQHPSRGLPTTIRRILDVPAEPEPG